MGLLNTATTENAAVTAVFEDEDTGTQALAKATPSDLAAVANPVTAVVPRANTAVAAVRRPIVADVFAVLRDAFPVEYNTLPQIICTNGNFVCREDKKNLGDTIVFELQSFQDSWVVSPNDDEAPVEVLRFSNDGVVCTDEDQTLVADHLKWLQENGYPKASLKQRAVVVGMIEATAKDAGMTDELVQFDLSPKSRVMWERFLVTTSMKLSKGKINPTSVSRIKATTQLATGPDSKDFTQAKFDLA